MAERAAPAIKTTDLSLEVRARFAADYPTTTNADLATKYGLTVRQVERLAKELQVRKTSKSAALASAAAKRAGMTIEEARQREAYIVEQFATRPAAAIARELGMKLKAVEGVIHRKGLRKTNLVTPRQPEYRAPGWASTTGRNDSHARLTAEQRAKLPPVGMDTAKRTVAPAFVDTRFTVKEGETVMGCGFASMGPGRYCEDGRQWGARP